MPKYRKKPIVVEAVRFNKKGAHPAIQVDGMYGHRFEVEGTQGYVRVYLGDWIITEPDGSGHYPCSDDIFRASYEEVTDE